MKRLQKVIAICSVVCSFPMSMVLAQPPDSAPDVAKSLSIPVMQAARKGEHPSWHVLQVRHVRPSVIAWQLDPVHNPEPNEFLESRKILDKDQPGKNKPSTFLARPPEGVEIVTFKDSQNALFFYANEQGARVLEEMARFLDRPLKQVETEALFVELDPDAAQDLNLRWDDELIVSNDRGDARARVEQLVAQNKAKKLAAPRVTSVNTLAAEMGFSTSTPVFINGPGQDGDFRISGKSEASKSKAFISDTRFSTIFVPMINNDGTITLSINLLKTVRLSPARLEGEVLRAQPESSILLDTPAKVQAVVNMQDGSTIAITGPTLENLLPDLRSEVGKMIPTPGRRVVVFITAREIRRVGG